MPSPCPSCSKLCSLETAEPEVNDLEMDADGQVSASARVARTSACCGEEMKEFTYELTDDRSADLTKHEQEFHNGEKQEYTIDEDSSEVDESGGSRYAKNMIKCVIQYDISCDACTSSEDKETKERGHIGNFTMEDSTNAGSFEELV